MKTAENKDFRYLPTIADCHQAPSGGTLKAVARVRIPSGLHTKSQVRRPGSCFPRYCFAILTTF